MTARALVMAALALVGVGYLLIEFGRLVLDDLTAQRAAAEDAAYDAETVTWLHALAEPTSEFDAWCEQAIALTRPPEDTDLTLWEHELADGAR